MLDIEEFKKKLRQKSRLWVLIQGKEIGVAISDETKNCNTLTQH